MNDIEKIVSRYRQHRAQCKKRKEEIDREIEQLSQERKRMDKLRWPEGLLRPILKEIIRQTPEIKWEQKDEYCPLGLRGTVTVRGQTESGQSIYIIFSELGDDLWFDIDHTCSHHTPETMGAVNSMNTVAASVGDGTPLLEYIHKQILKP